MLYICRWFSYILILWSHYHNSFLMLHIIPIDIISIRIWNRSLICGWHVEKVRGIRINLRSKAILFLLTSHALALRNSWIRLSLFDIAIFIRWGFAIICSYFRIIQNSNKFILQVLVRRIVATIANCIFCPCSSTFILIAWYFI